VNYYSVEGDMVYDGTSYYEVTAIQQAQRQPGSLKALSALVSSAVCPEGQNGFFMNVTYQVMDNSTPPQPHQVQGLAVQEDITNRLLSRICGGILARAVVPSCDKEQFPWLYRFGSRRIVW